MKLKPFLWAAVLWGFLSCLGLAWFSTNAARLSQIEWFLTLFLLCVADLFALAKLFFYVFSVVVGGEKKQVGLVIRASYWATLKLACLLLISSVLWKGRSIPEISLLLGLGTIVVVPLVGGSFWSHKEFHHA